MNVPRLSTVLGTVVALFGCWWTWSVIQSTMDFLFHEGEVVFLFIISPMMVLPGVLAVYFGFHLTRWRKPENFKGAIGCFALFAAIQIFIFLKRISPFRLVGRIEEALFTFLAVLAAIALYLFLVSFFMRREGLATGGFKNLIGKGIVFIVSWQIWTLTAKISEVYFSMKKDGSDPWMMFMEGGLPLFLAWIFYKTSTNQLGLNGVGKNDLVNGSRPIHSETNQASGTDSSHR